MKNIIAFDCGNSSFRVVLGRYDNGKIQTEVIEQIPNEMIKIHGYYYWDILMIYQGLLKGLKKAVKTAGRIDSIGICTWGVDFAFYSREGVMLSQLCSYRNTYGKEVLDELPEETRAEMFEETGIACDKINSVFLLKALYERVRSVAEQGERLLMVPDMLNYMFTGRMLNEPSELSTTQLMDVRSKAVSSKICRMFEIPETLFDEMGVHGEMIGVVTEEIKEYLEISYDIPVICVPSHDTASAVLAVPAAEEDFAFISCGTWALIGTELDAPVITEEVRNLGLTNEMGAFDKITLLKNSAGMFLIQRLREEYQKETGESIDWEALNALGDSCDENVPLFPVNSTLFFNPGNMSDAIWSYFLRTGQTAEDKNWNILIKSFQVSMACSFAVTIGEIQRICKKEISAVYIVGGGSQNGRLCQMTADLLQKRVVAGGKESTSLGNIAAQIKYFQPQLQVKDLRNIICESVQTKEYLYGRDIGEVLKRYEKLPA